MNWKKSLGNFAKQKRAIVGLEAAIILIAFVIIAAVFSFMVVNQGLFATEQGKTVIQQGLQQASTPLSVDGTTFVKTAADGANVTGILIPLKTFGSKYVSMNENTTVVTLKIGANAWSNVYEGVNASAIGETFNVMLANVTENQGKLYIQNSNNDQALDSSEKGYLVISLSEDNAALVRSQVTIEIRLEKTAPLTIEFTIPESMPAAAWVNV
ncbi:MAG TPA: archaellin/type IV pilin N-terminal domain-containing protein [Candidatus Acidoferrales bacterium]|nr:archaellin/type IV pilin N-terminal domain-containing protein [Candidatus Acidoferrales bacterium]